MQFLSVVSTEITCVNAGVGWKPASSLTLLRTMGKAISTWTSVGHVRAAQYGAYCLDGSTPGYWYQPPMPLPRTSQWLIFLDGGAWCYDAHSCESRAKGFKGTGEKSIPQSNFWPYAGHMDADPKVNPIFSGFHRLHFHYCDGSSYSGDREAPLPSEGKKLLYLRGRRVLAAQLDTALQAGLRDAEEVLFSGGSAGGIGAMHAAKALRAALPHVRRFKVLIVSGFFLERRTGMQQQSSDPNAELQSPSAASSSVATGTGHPTCRRGRGADEKCIPWVHKMRRMCEMHNCTNALLDGGCGRSLHAHEAWRCLFGKRAAAAVRLPTFFINSALDSWQMVNVWRRFAHCRWEDSKCTAPQADADVAETNLMLRAFIRDMRASGALLRRGNGAFIYSCNEHVAGLSNAAFYGYMVNGWSMRQALHAWWNDDDDAPATRHTHLPCELLRRRQGVGKRKDTNASRLRHACDASCDRFRMKRRLSQECACEP
jgi:hypothetical protein